MVSVTEGFTQQTPLQAALDAGLEQIDNQQVITFTQYTRTVLPADGYVFWVIGAGALQAKGSLHVTTELHQDESSRLVCIASCSRRRKRLTP